MVADHPGVSYWSGYCNTHVRVYADEDAYIILAPQVMSYSPAAGAMAGGARDRISPNFMGRGSSGLDIGVFSFSVVC